MEKILGEKFMAEVESFMYNQRRVDAIKNLPIYWRKGIRDI